MNFADYSGPGRPLRGSTDWAAVQIERLLEEEERRRRVALADAASNRVQQQYGRPARSGQQSVSDLDQPGIAAYRRNPDIVLVDGTDWTLGGAAVGGAIGAFGGGLLGGVGGGAACTPVAPGVGTLACGAGGAAEGAAIGGSLGATAGAAIGSGIDALASEEEDEEDERERFCRDRYAVDTEVCKAIARRRGKKKAALCYESAAARYAACLRGLPVPPFITWNN